MIYALNVTIGILFLIVAVVTLVMWFIALFEVLSRQDLKESKILWALLLIFLGPVGMIAYFFTEGRKTYGIWSVVSCVLAVLLPFVFAIVSFVVSTSAAI